MEKIEDEKAAPLNPSLVPLKDFYVVHISDLISVGSSAYDPKFNPPTGWVPMLRNAGAQLSQLLAVVTWLRGGEQTLAQAGIETTTFVKLDETFLRAHSKQPDVAIAYFRNPKRWAEDYLRKNGIDVFIHAFNPQGSQFDRAKKFLKVYEAILKKSGRWRELERLVRSRFRVNLVV